MAFKGGWMRQAFYSAPTERLHTADGEHLRTDQADPQGYSWQAPAAPDYGSAPEYPGLEWVSDTGGLVLDVTPDEHDDGMPVIAWGDELSQQTASAAAHALDHGAARQHAYAPPPLQFHTERYMASRWEGFGVPPQPSPEALTRGLNGLPENNPPLESYGGEGFRRGLHEQQWIDRKFYVGQRVHTPRLLEPNTAWAPEDQPAPADPNAYTSPFGSMARAITRGWSTPTIRRQPPGLSESLTNDGSDDMSAPSSLWVVG